MKSVETQADVLIAGAGPAGAALAIRLARLGHGVTLVDRAEFPREKPCGEGVMPGGLGELALLGIDVPRQPFRGVRYRQAEGGGEAEGLFPAGARGAGIRRWDLDAALARAARAEANVEWLGGTAIAGPLLDEAGGVVGLRTADGRELRARLTVAADGAASPLRRAMGWDRVVTRHRDGRFGVRRHFRLAGGTPAPEFVHVYLKEGSEAYLTPLVGGEVGLAILADAPGVPVARLFADTVAAHAELQKLLAGAEPVSEAKGASPLNVRARRRVDPGLVLLGDAAGNCDPISGTGITQALVAARLLSEAIQEAGGAVSSPAALLRFDRRREAMMAGYRRLAALMLTMLRGRRRTALSLRALTVFPWIFTRLMGVAAGNQPQRVAMAGSVVARA